TSLLPRSADSSGTGHGAEPSPESASGVSCTVISIWPEMFARRGHPKTAGRCGSLLVNVSTRAGSVLWPSIVGSMPSVTGSSANHGAGYEIVIPLTVLLSVGPTSPG